MDKYKKLAIFARISAIVVAICNSLCLLRNIHPSGRLLVATGMLINALCIRKLKQAINEIAITIIEIFQFLYLAFKKRRDEEE